MNEFNNKLQAAKIRQLRVVILATLTVFLLGITAFSIIAYTAGTSLVVRPTDANKSYSIKILSGLSVFISGALYSVSSESLVLVSAPGFREKTLSITPQFRGKSVEVILDELPGKLTVTTVPELNMVRWKINGERVGSSPVFEVDLYPGTYQLEANHKYYKRHIRKVDIARAKNSDIKIPLLPVNGSLSIQSSPEGALIKINNEYIGETPLHVNVNGGKFEVSLSLKGYQPISNTIEITDNKSEIQRNYRLLRMTSKLLFKISPKGGVLLIDGKKVASNSAYSITSSTETTLSYSLKGYYSQERKISLNPGVTQTILINLKPEYGIVEINSKPSAKVTINGKEFGETPVSAKLLARKQLVVIKRSGYRLVEKSILPTSKRTTKILVDLHSEQAARLRDAPKSYTNDVGMELALFKPTSFTMGAPRYEKGQRANEFLRKIRFTKPFYASTHEVTLEQFREFRPDHKPAGNENLPATSLTWINAAAYCNWLSKKENLEPFYYLKGGNLASVNKEANGYRLLTEAEWEWLARKANREITTKFSWGDKSVVPTMTGNIADESSKGANQFYVPNYTDGYVEVAPVGSFKKGLSGLYDLTGNVREWVHDTYSVQPPISNIVEIDPLSTSLGRNRVVKGSSWRSGTRSTLRAAYRDGMVNRQDDIGFRIGRYL